MKVIIAGHRYFFDYDHLKNVCDEILSEVKTPIEIVSGGCYGADKLGERYAKEKGYAVKLFIPEWKKYGASAGPIRNELMAKYSDMLIAFYNGKSNGTGNMIKNANKHHLDVTIVEIGL